MEYAALTQSQIDILAKVSSLGSVELSPVEAARQGYPHIDDHVFLANAGYLTIEQTYTDPHPGNHRFRFTRTAKPLP